MKLSLALSAGTMTKACWILDSALRSFFRSAGLSLGQEEAIWVLGPYIGFDLVNKVGKRKEGRTVSRITQSRNLISDVTSELFFHFSR